MTAVAGATMLASAAWPGRAPAAAILLWQALGLGWGLAAVGALAALAARPAHAGVAGGVLAFASDAPRQAANQVREPIALMAFRVVCLVLAAALLALLCWVLAAACTAVLRTRRRHRALLALLARGDPKAPGALVLAHERAHIRERHDLVLLPFTALCRAFPRAGVAVRAQHAVALLVEMLADDRARRARPARELATALMRFGVAGATAAPSGALAAARADSQGDVAARVARLLEPQPGLAPPLWAGICCSAILLVVVPAALFVIPL